MSILTKIFSEIKEKNLDLTTKVRQICDQIIEEEKQNLKYPDISIKGPRVFLCLEAGGRNNDEIGFLVLEREDEELYLAVYYTTEKYTAENFPGKVSLKRRKVWEINENKPEKIIGKYAAKLKFLRGE